MITTKNLRPAWAEINLDNLAYNTQQVKKLINPNTIIMAVMKADGYGHGAVQIAKTLLENGVQRFAVAILSEGIELRKNYHDTPILILGYTPKENVKEVIDHNLTQTVWSYEQASCFSKIAQEMRQKVKLHIKIDTGMNRQGFTIGEQTIPEIQKICSLQNVLVEGIFTHFAVAESADKSFTYSQLEKFNKLCDSLEKWGVHIPLKHVSNSAAIIDLPEANFDMVRPGIMLYGLYPSAEVNKDKVSLKEVMSLKMLCNCAPNRIRLLSLLHLS